MRIAVVMFNLGGPDRPDAIRPFLFNLFKDPAIIGLPGVLRLPLAWLIAKRRAPEAREIYGRLGGRSPLRELTEAQANALEAVLGDRGHDIRVFVCMRYWHPMSDEVAEAVRDWKADRVVLLPLYPQFSSTTTGSSLADWARARGAAGLRVPEDTVCCYPEVEGFVAAYARLIAERLDQASGFARVRVLFSAHGLPKRVIAGGDPYQWQVERTVGAVLHQLGRTGLDHVICYQSRVGPLEWIGPDTEAEVRRAGADGAAVVMVPIAFVSEHSETLVELDITYRALAEESGVPAYLRVPAVGTTPEFVDGLAGLVENALASDAGVASHLGARLCPSSLTRCICAASPNDRS
ncbi:MAG: ferrochelatase [Rhodospirillales bacterium]|nr:MAG: ferrochelatase [Rhodospirillales bacterium]